MEANGDLVIQSDGLKLILFPEHAALAHKIRECSTNYPSNSNTHNSTSSSSNSSSSSISISNTFQPTGANSSAAPPPRHWSTNSNSSRDSRRGAADIGIGVAARSPFVSLGDLKLTTSGAAQSGGVLSRKRQASNDLSVLHEHEEENEDDDKEENQANVENEAQGNKRRRRQENEVIEEGTGEIENGEEGKIEVEEEDAQEEVDPLHMSDLEIVQYCNLLDIPTDLRVPSLRPYGNNHFNYLRNLPRILHDQKLAYYARCASMSDGEIVEFLHKIRKFIPSELIDIPVDSLDAVYNNNYYNYLRDLPRLVDQRRQKVQNAKFLSQRRAFVRRMQRLSTL